MQQLPPYLWLIAPVSDEPHTSLMNWRVFEVVLSGQHSPTLHLVGYAFRYGEGRVSSAVQSLDLGRRVATTISGRCYALLGESAYDGRAEFVWREWVGATGARVVGDVTAKLFQHPGDAV